MTSLFSDYYFVLQLTLKIFAVFGLIRQFEYLFLYKQFLRDGLFSWSSMGRNTSFKSKSLQLFVDPLLSYPGNILMVIVTAAFNILLLVDCLPIPVSIYLAVLAISHILYCYRRGADREGSDNMYTISVLPLLMASFLTKEPMAIPYSLFFIAAQALFCYFTTGVFKVLSKEWREGHAIRIVMANDAFGNKSIFEYLQRNQSVGKILSWCAMVLLITFPLCILMPLPYCVAFLVIGLIFHISNALILGLNRFLLAFLSAYPSILYVCAILHQP